MKNFQILLLSASVLSILSLANINGEEIAERGGGGARGYSHDYNRESTQYHNQGNAQYHNYGDAYRRDGYDGGYGAGYGGGYYGGYYGGAPAYPAYGYPAGGYIYPPGSAFPGEAAADSIYRANQHPPQ